MEMMYLTPMFLKTLEESQWQLINVFDVMGAKQKHDYLSTYKEKSNVVDCKISGDFPRRVLNVILDNGLSVELTEPIKSLKGVESSNSIFNKSTAIANNRFQFLLSK